MPLEMSQQLIIKQLNVSPSFDAKTEATQRIEFIKSTLIASRRVNLILGISGGIDSSVTGRLAQLAVEQLRAQNYKAQFIAVRLPYGVQLDEEDAQSALRFIQPDQSLVINIKQACDELLCDIIKNPVSFNTPAHQDFVLGNIKARQRMIAQYALANIYDGLVLGTDHAAEAVMGFFTKYGDGACDLAPLNGLTKRRVKEIGRFLGAPLSLVNKKPTADLENLCPQRLDEEAYGVTYNEIDDFLEGKEINTDSKKIILDAFIKTEHKRQPPLVFSE